jgi:hypothetical protein
VSGIANANSIEYGDCGRRNAAASQPSRIFPAGHFGAGGIPLRCFPTTPCHSISSFIANDGTEVICCILYNQFSNDIHYQVRWRVKNIRQCR